MYEARTFTIPEIKGISQKTIDEHLKLYQGYVKHTNLILEKSEKGETDYETKEARRRLGFEFNGMRNHEYYFEQLEGGPKDHADDCTLKAQMDKQWGGKEEWLKSFKDVLGTRGVGWAILYYDKQTDKLVNAWIDEQQIGQLNGLSFIFGIDMWEHSYMLDYTPGEKGKYIDAYLDSVNWQVSGKRFSEASGR